MTQNIETYINELRGTIIVAVHNYEIWWTYKEKETRGKYLDTMNQYTSFFQTSIHAHFVALLIALYRMYETRKDTVNISGLIKLLKKEGKLSKSVIKGFHQQYNDAHKIWVKVSILRNNVFAHRSNKYSIEEIFEKAGVTYDEFIDLIEKSKTLLNDISHHWNRDSHAFNLGAESDTVQLLKDLKEFNSL